MSNSPLQAGDARDDQTGRLDVLQPNGRPRPLSPHLQVWRWHVTMLGSILHRVSGSALYGGAVIVVLWLLAAAFGPEAYGTFTGLMGSPLGLLIWFGLSLALMYHFASGVRHLVWDSGAGLEPKTASTLTTASIVFAGVATLAFWVYLFASGKVVL